MDVKFLRTFETISLLILAFLIILIVFFGINFGFKQAKSMSGNAVSVSDGSQISSLDWILITIVSSVIIIALIELIVRKNILKINWDL